VRRRASERRSSGRASWLVARSGGLRVAVSIGHYSTHEEGSRRLRLCVRVGSSDLSEREPLDLEAFLERELKPVYLG